MKLAQLVSLFRRRADDARAPYLWSDAEVIGFFNEAEREAAERGKLIHDDETPEVCRIAIEDQARHSLHGSILNVRQARFLDVRGRYWLLQIASPEFIDRLNGSCPQRTGRPEYLVIHGNGQSVALWPSPAEPGELMLSVTRFPLCEMTGPDDSPEIPERWHVGLLDWALRCAYLKPDTDAFSPDSANAHEARFVARFGQAIPAGVQMQQAQRRLPQVRATW